jgi:predicted dinucleotide-binding enzyme
MKVGILGSGDVAKALAGGFMETGHVVMLGTRNPSKLEDWDWKNRGGVVGSFAEAAQFGELLVLAVKGTAASEVLRAAGITNFAGKTVVDACNPIADAPPVNGVLRFFTTLEDSLMERLQREFPAAHFVKAFNSVGSAAMFRPTFQGGKPTMFLCGNDDGAKRAVTGILDQFGWEAADMGGATAARAIEPLAVLWCIPGFLEDSWTHAFHLLR